MGQLDEWVEGFPKVDGSWPVISGTKVSLITAMRSNSVPFAQSPAKKVPSTRASSALVQILKRLSLAKA